MSVSSVDLIRDQQEIANLKERLKYETLQYWLALLRGSKEEAIKWSKIVHATEIEIGAGCQKNAN